jgi:hypothetical protein
MVGVNSGLVPFENILKIINDKIVNKSINKITFLDELKNKEILEKQTNYVTKLSNDIIRPKRIQNDKDVITIKDSINNILSKLASQSE